MGAAFSPDGSKIAVTLSQDGNSEIYLLSPRAAILKRLTNTPFIDTSPTWSPDGSRIAFVSDRHGSPQIWVMNADGSGPQQAHAARQLQPDAVVVPAQGRAAHRLHRARRDAWPTTSSPSTSTPASTCASPRGTARTSIRRWAPNGRAVAYESSRGGVWVSTADGRTERQVYRGSALAPQWSPTLKR